MSLPSFDTNRRTWAMDTKVKCLGSIRCDSSMAYSTESQRGGEQPFTRTFLPLTPIVEERGRWFGAGIRWFCFMQFKRRILEIISVCGGKQGDMCVFILR